VPRQANAKDKAAENVAEITEEVLRQLEMMQEAA
jgi:hypothetical protein